MNNILIVGMGSIAKRHIRVVLGLYPSARIYLVSVRNGMRDEAKTKSKYKDKDKDKGENRALAIKPEWRGSVFIMNNIHEVEGMDIDAAIIASPSSFHMQHLKVLHGYNIPCLIEKPISNRLLDTVWLRENNVNAVVGYNLRFSSLLQTCKKLIGSEKHGKVLQVLVHVNQYLPDWRPDTDYRNTVSAKQSLGGGVLLELSHELDIIQWLFGSVKSICAKLEYSNTLDIDVEDSVDALLSMESGVLINLHMDMIQRVSRRYLLISCERGSIEIDLLKQTLNTCSEDKRNWSSEVFCQSRDEIFSQQFQNFLAYIKGDLWLGSSLNDALASLAVADKARESNDKQTWVDILHAH